MQQKTYVQINMICKEKGLELGINILKYKAHEIGFKNDIDLIIVLLHEKLDKALTNL